ncbi:MAG: hypothetical protein JO232_15135 [Verrucomicrobia bacterium]|nr:hypothetical protein [Verrucomicrobiota bacterium]
MATRRTTRKTAGRVPVKQEAASDSDGDSGVKVRMYRQGLGDCFLITLPGKNRNPYYVMIDCGVVLGTPDAAAKMQEVVKNIAATTNNHIDLLLVTHEHWDHLSGFIQARDYFAGLKVDKVWFAWTEDPQDELANKLRAENQALRLALASACARLQLGASGHSAIDGFLEFFGAAGQGTTGDALKIVKGFCQDIRFCRPTDAPIEPDGVNARLFVLGPPHSEAMIKRFNPSKSHPETYGFAASEVNKLASATSEGDLSAPFDTILQIPFDAARQMPFFQAHYWGENPDARKEDGAESTETSRFETRAEFDQSWRRIDSDWFDISSSLALQLDSATNNTSLVLAIEMGNGKVLLFAADAQVGNWLSWQDLCWTLAGKSVTGPDLLGRTVLYKAGHHGSHNATLQEKGLEMMTNLEIAFIPVDHEMAVKKGWGNLPLRQLEQRLSEKTKGRVLRVDKDIPPSLTDCVKQDDAKNLYYEITI